MLDLGTMICRGGLIAREVALYVSLLFFPGLDASGLIFDGCQTSS